jgi:hypothetical protein
MLDDSYGRGGSALATAKRRGILHPCEISFFGPFGEATLDYKAISRRQIAVAVNKLEIAVGEDFNRIKFHPLLKLLGRERFFIFIGVVATNANKIATSVKTSPR